VSIEQRIYESKNSYYKALYDSQHGWHEAEHTIWPWTSYLATVLAGAYEEFEGRVARERDSAGSKQDRVRQHILEQAPPAFRRRDIERALPGVSSATVRLVLNELRDSGRIQPQGSGPSAGWLRIEPPS
jgi:Fic family protein